MNSTLIIIIFIIVIILYLLYKNKENFTSEQLPSMINVLSNDIKQQLNNSYFLSDKKIVNELEYSLVYKNIKNYRFNIIYHETNKNLVKGGLVKIPSTNIYYFISFGKLHFNKKYNPYNINDSLNILRKRIEDVNQYIKDMGEITPHYVYMEFPYNTNNNSNSNSLGLLGILMIYNYGKLLFNISDKYYYQHEKNKENNNYIQKLGNPIIIDILKNQKINNIDIIINELDDNKNPKNYIINHFDLNDKFNIF
jgi:hypothetical protein